MFQSKNSFQNSGSPLSETNRALPNYYGKIRTLKEDYANFKGGKPSSSSGEGESLPPSSELVPPAAPQIPQQTSEKEMTSRTSEKFSAAEIPVQNMPPKEFATEQKKPEQGKTVVPNPFGSETFFETESPFSEKKTVPDTASREPQKKSSKKLGGALLALLILVILGGGGYWWFFLRNGSGGADTVPAAPVAPTPPVSQPAPDQQPAASEENKGLSRWKLDSAADKSAVSLAIKNYTDTFVASAQESELVEVKIVSAEDQPIGARKFEDMFSFLLPAAINDRLTDEYSLFCVKEKGEARLGAAFRLSASDLTTTALEKSESKLVENLASFYLSKATFPKNITFVSSKYKTADIRYFNFPGLANTSLDYSVVVDGQNSFFIFSTSKDSVRKILDYMSEK